MSRKRKKGGGKKPSPKDMPGAADDSGDNDKPSSDDGSASPGNPVIRWRLREGPRAMTVSAQDSSVAIRQSGLVHLTFFSEQRLDPPVVYQEVLPDGRFGEKYVTEEINYIEMLKQIECHIDLDYHAAKNLCDRLRNMIEGFDAHTSAQIQRLAERLEKKDSKGGEEDSPREG